MNTFLAIAIVLAIFAVLYPLAVRAQKRVELEEEEEERNDPRRCTCGTTVDGARLGSFDCDRHGGEIRAYHRWLDRQRDPFSG